MMDAGCWKFFYIPNSNNYSIITPPLVNNITYQLSIIQDVEGCDGETSIAISVYPDPVIEIETDPYSCLGSMHDVESITPHLHILHSGVT